MKRCWFKDDEGGYYRNEGLVWREYERALKTGRWLLARKLNREWESVWSEGVTRKDALERGDRLVTQAPFCHAFPDKPGLWMLDPIDCPCGSGTYKPRRSALDPEQTT